MDIKTAKKLDYILKVISNELNQNFDFKVIWNNDYFGMFTADLTKFKKGYPIEEKFVNNYVSENSLSEQFLPLRKELFEKFNFDHSLALNDFNNALEDHSSIVLKALIDFVKVDNSDIPNDNVIYNVNLLNQSKELEFMFLPKDVSLTPISLLATSRN